MKFREFLENYLTKQQSNYDCGVATIVSILKYFKIDYGSYNHVETQLKTSEKTGTTPVNMINVIKSYNLNVIDGIGDIGYVLLNTNILYDDTVEQNGHWSFYIKKDNKIELYDVYKDKTSIISNEELLELTKNVKVRDSIYNNLIKNISN